ncbi:MAG: FAD:protein FMN transferase [Bacteroidia bacterium]
MREILYITLSTFLFACTSNKQTESNYIQLQGNAQGTTFQIQYEDSLQRDFSIQIDSLLKQLDNSLSTYLPQSIISRINKNDTSVVLDEHFIKVFNRAQEISKLTDGAFDITVAPLVNAYGFGFTKKENIDSLLVDSLLQYVGYRKVKIVDGKLLKEQAEIQLDFNAIAQGYSVDVLADFLEKNGIENYMVEIGGELRCKGVNAKGNFWNIGIDKPLENSEKREMQTVVPLKNRAMATSGNYRKFYEKDGLKFSHTINPKTGWPVQHQLLSATVLANDAMTADAFATVFMVLGKDAAINFIENNKELELDVYLIYQEGQEMKVYSTLPN